MHMEKISLYNISKTFSIGVRRKHSALGYARALFSSREAKKDFLALDSVSLKINPGEIVGMMGSNGSGKSTLLRIMAGIYQPDSGTVKANGKVISLINLGVGLLERLPMRDNIFLVGSLFGMSSGEMQARLDSIVRFSELGEFLDTKIYQFSAGMIQRLAFSIAIHADPDILLLDEVFEVGDEDFRKKSGEKIRHLAKEGVAVVLVSHDEDLIRRNCTSLLRFEHGKIISREQLSEKPSKP